MKNYNAMTEQEYQNARAAIISVTAGRVVCAVIATSLAIKGEWVGAGLFLSAIPLLHFGLPVTR